MAGYTRQSTFADGDTITAALFNNEYNQLLNAFGNTSGHKHDGTANEGPVIGLIGDAGETSPNNKVLIDTTNNYIEFYVQVSNSPVQQLYIADGAIVPVTDSDVDLGTTGLRFKDAYIDTVTTTGNVAVGGNLTVTGTTTFNGGTITMGDAATDNVVFGADVNSNIIPNTDSAFDLGSSTQEWRDLYLDGTAHIDTLDVDVNATIAGTLGVTGVLTGTSLDISGNVDIDGVLETDGLSINGTTVTSTAAELNLLDGKAFLDEDNMASNSATGIASQQSVKAYVDSQVTAQDLDFLGDSGGALSIDLDSESLTIAGGTGLDTVGSGNTVTVNIDSTVATLTGTQTLTNKTLTSPDVNTPDIDGGTIDSTVIGGATPAAGTFTTLTANTSLTGTLATAAQPNITSLGTLTGLTGGTGDLNWDSGTLFVDSSANSVGIGTSSPARPLHISGTTVTQLELEQTSASSDVRMLLDAGGTNGQIQFAGASHASVPNTLSLVSAGDTRFVQDGQTVMHIDSGNSGRVGIGTDSPDTLMEIVGADPVLTIRDTETGVASANATLRLAESGGSSSLGAYFDIAMTGQNLTFGHSTDGSADAEQMRLEGSTGDLALGVTSASGRLHVNKNGTAQIIALFSSDLGTNNRNMQILSPASDSTSAPFEFSTSNSFQFTIDGGAALNIASDKNVGIGTTSPDGNLHVSSGSAGTVTASTDANELVLEATANVGMTLLTGNSSIARIRFGDADSNARGNIFYNHANDSLGIQTAASTAMTIDSSGNVGIGTTSPSTTLTVAGSGDAETGITATHSRSGVGYTLLLNNTNNGANKGSGIKWQSGGHDTGAIITRSDATAASGDAPAYMTFHTSTDGSEDIAERMRINSSGIAVTGSTLVSDDQTNDWIKQEVSGTTSTISLGNTESTGGTAQWSYSRSTGSLSGNIGSNAGTNFMTVLGTGNVGIGETTPLVPLHISRDSASGENIAFLLDNNNTTAGNEIGMLFRSAVGSTNTDFQITGIASGANDMDLTFASDGGTERMRIDSSGNVGIGMTSAPNGSDTCLSIFNTATPRIKFHNNTTGSAAGDGGEINMSGSDFIFENREAGNVRFFANGSEHMRIDNEGNFLIGKTVHDQNNTRGVDITNTGAVVATNDGGISFLANRIGSDGQTFLFRRQNVTVGSISVSGSATTYATSSDHRLKENVDYNFTALDRVAQLKPARFNFIATPTVTVDGFVAHEVQDVVPEAIIGEKDAVDSDGNPDYQGIDQSKLVPLLTKAIQEQQTIIESLTARITTLEG